jgi:hypothetical protein
MTPGALDAVTKKMIIESISCRVAGDQRAEQPPSPSPRDAKQRRLWITFEQM